MENISKYYPATNPFLLLDSLVPGLGLQCLILQHTLAMEGLCEIEVQFAITLVKKDASQTHGLRVTGWGLNPAPSNTMACHIPSFTFWPPHPFFPHPHFLVQASMAFHLDHHNHVLTGPTVSTLTLPSLSSILTIHTNMGL